MDIPISIFGLLCDSYNNVRSAALILQCSFHRATNKVYVSSLRENSVDLRASSLCIISFFGICQSDPHYLHFLLLPDMQWTNTWGKVYYTLAASNAGQVYNVPLSFSYNIILAYSPIAATAISMCLTWLVCSFIGLLILALNLFKRKSGVFIAAGFILLEVIALNSAFSTTYFSPVSWCSLACLNITGYSQYPSVVYAVSVLLVSILGLALFSTLIIYKNKGYITKEEL